MSGKQLKGDPFDALGDPNRRAIVELLRAGGQSVQSIADRLPISRPAVSRHLALLQRAGLVVQESQGRLNVYRLHGKGVEEIRQYMESVWTDAATRFRLAAQNTKQSKRK